MNRKTKTKVFLADVVAAINADEQLVKARGKKFTVQGIGKVIKSERKPAFRPAGKDGHKHYYKEGIVPAVYDLLVKQYNIKKAYFEDFDSSTGADEAEFVPSRDIQKMQAGSEMKERVEDVIDKMTSTCSPSEQARSQELARDDDELDGLCSGPFNDEPKQEEKEDPKSGGYYELPPQFFMTLEGMIKDAVQEQICEARPDLCDEGVIVKDRAKVIQKYAAEINRNVYWRGVILGAAAATGIILLGLGFATNYIQSLF